LLTKRNTYLPLWQDHRNFFAEVAFETTNGDAFMKSKNYTKIDDVTQTGGRRTKNRRKNKKTKHRRK
jgi:hypothetical protein